MAERTKAKNLPWYVTVLFILVLILLSPLILLIVLISLVPWLNIRFIQRPKLLRRVRNEWLPKNKFVLFVYSDNEPWKEYAEKNIIPKILSNAVILNWSHRKDWINSNALEVQLFRNFQWGRQGVWRQNVRMGGQNYNHSAIVFKPWNNPKVVKFWEGWKDHEFGNDEKLRASENELYSYLSAM